MGVILEAFIKAGFFQFGRGRMPYRGLAIFLTVLFGACSGKDDSSGNQATVNIAGSIVGSTGDQTGFTNWHIVAFERDTGIARASAISSVGAFTLQNLSKEAAQSLVLLTPNFQYRAALSLRGESGNVAPYFVLGDAALPEVISRGQYLEFFTESTVTVTTDRSTDTDSDRIPDGLDTATSLADTDGDSVDNLADPDIDGDGIANWFDTDEDGDSVIDIFDADANGDGVNDNEQAGTGEMYFTEGLEFLAVQIERTPQSDSSVRTSMVITAKVRADVAPAAVTVRGAPSLIDGAVIVGTDNVEVAWDKSLLDDGLSNDRSASDNHFARRIFLESGKVPKANQLIFVQLLLGGTITGEQWLMEFPYTFPNLTPGDITATATRDEATNNVTVAISGTPFESNTNYLWLAEVYDADQLKVWDSTQTPGTTSSLVIPSDAFESAAVYTIYVKAQAFDRVPSYPAYTISSPAISYTAP